MFCESVKEGFIRYRWLILILLISFALRVCLVLRGGYFFWADEVNYNISSSMVEALLNGDLMLALRRINTDPMHTGGLLLGLIPAFVHVIVSKILSIPKENILLIPVLFYSSISVVYIGLTYALARKVKADRNEATIAALLVACSASTFYFSRHIVPYDLAMCMALVTLIVGLGEHQNNFWSIIYGFLAGFVYLIYNKYYSFTIILVAIYALMAKDIRDAVKRAALCIPGIISIPVILTVIAYVLNATHPYMYGVYYRLSHTDFFGDPSEGWRIPIEFFWHAEHLFFIVWMVAGCVVLYKLIRKQISFKSREAIWFLILAGFYGLLVLGSTILHVDTVKARGFRIMVPFFCLMTAAVLKYHSVKKILRGRVVFLGVAVLLISTAYNFYIPLTLRFPSYIDRMVEEKYGGVSKLTNIDCPPLLPKLERTGSDYALVNNFFIYSPLYGVFPPPDGEVIFSCRHPFQYYPYQYEFYLERERRILRDNDVSIRLIKINGQHN